MLSEIDFTKMPRFRLHAFRIVTLVPEWARAYGVPEEAIVRQLAWAHGWIASNPRKAPKKDMVRFLFNWMRKAKQYGNLRVPEVKVTVKTEVEVEEMTYEEMVAIRKANMERPHV